MDKDTEKRFVNLENQINQILVSINGSHKDGCDCGQSTCDSQIVHSSGLARYNDAAGSAAIESQRAFIRSLYPNLLNPPTA